MKKTIIASASAITLCSMFALYALKQDVETDIEFTPAPTATPQTAQKQDIKTTPVKTITTIHANSNKQPEETLAKEQTEFETLYEGLKERIDSEYGLGSYDQNGEINQDLVNIIMQEMQGADAECRLQPLMHYMKDKNIDFEVLEAIAIIYDDVDSIRTATLRDMRQILLGFDMLTSKTSIDARESIVTSNNYEQTIKQIDDNFGGNIDRAATKFLSEYLEDTNESLLNNPNLTALQNAQFRVLERLHDEGARYDKVDVLKAADRLDLLSDRLSHNLEIASQKRDNHRHIDLTPRHCRPQP
jgi:hypothetical protein